MDDWLENGIYENACSSTGEESLEPSCHRVLSRHIAQKKKKKKKVLFSLREWNGTQITLLWTELCPIPLPERRTYLFSDS